VEAGSLVAELKRRRVFRALVGYGIAAFAVLQIEPVMHGLHWPDEVLSYVVVALAVGFPVVVSLAWIFDVKAGRIERTASTPAAGPKGVRLGLALVGIGVLAAAPGVVWYFVVRGTPRPVPASVAAAPATTPSIAVLPFADMSPGKDQEYFSDGIAEEILDDLAQVEGLRVIGRTSSFSFKGKNDDLRAIGEKLGVAHVLEGSVRREGNRVRITTQLIEAAGGTHVWSKSFDKEMSGIFAVQDEIAKAVVEGLKIKLLAGKRTGTPEKQTTNPEAYAQFLVGNQLWLRTGSHDAAIEAYKKAVALDPNYAPAWALLAIQTYGRADDGDQTPHALAEGREAALVAAEKAVTLAPELPEAYEARGLVRWAFLWDWSGSKADFERALSLAPSRADAHRRVGQLSLSLGQIKEALVGLRRATELDPLNWFNWVWLGSGHIYQGELRMARSALGRAAELGPKQHEGASYYTAYSYLLEGDYDRALEWNGKLADEKLRLSIATVVAHVRGHSKEARDGLETLTGAWGVTQPYLLASEYELVGEPDHALEWLAKAYSVHDMNMRFVKAEPALRPLRSDPRYTDLLKKMNLPLD